mmetsp:Transcript_1361/g.2590  ORF Transcript_1361/g.2590 Transcript_1361/m.2590 type:complete len:652 (-) Transcript_1361:464-2419(-)
MADSAASASDKKSATDFDPVDAAKTVFVSGKEFHGDIGHPNFPQVITVGLTIEKGEYPSFEGEWSAMGQSALMRLDVSDDGLVEIRMYGPDEEMEPTTAKGKFKDYDSLVGEVFSEGEGGGEFSFKSGAPPDVDSAEEEDEEEGEEEEQEQPQEDDNDDEEEETKPTTDAKASADDAKPRAEVKGGAKPSGGTTETLEALEDIPMINPVMLFNLLSSRNIRLLILDARGEESRKKGRIPRSVFLNVPKTIPDAITVAHIQNWLPGRKEKMALRSYRLYQIVIVGESDSPDGLGYKIARVMNARQMQSVGGVSQGSLRLLRGGYAAFEELYAVFCDPKSDCGAEKMQPAFLHPMDYPSEIINRFLYLGSHRDSENKPVLMALGITKVLIISRHKGGNPFPSSFEYMRLGLQEGHGEDALHRAQQYIRACRLESAEPGSPEQRILVCGTTGNSAAAAVVLSFLMKERMITLKSAFSEVQRRRRSVCLSRPRWESLSRFEQELLKEDTLGSCVDLSHAPPLDADEPLPNRLVEGKTARVEGDSKDNGEYFKASRLKWSVNDYLQNKCEKLMALCKTLNARYVSLKRENQSLQSELNGLRKSNSRSSSSSFASGKSVDNSKLHQELQELRQTLKEYGTRLIRLGSDGADGTKARS